MAKSKYSTADKIGNAVDYTLAYQGTPGEKDNEDYMKSEREDQPKRMIRSYHYDGPLAKTKSKNKARIRTEKITRKRVSVKQ